MTTTRVPRVSLYLLVVAQQLFFYWNTTSTHAFSLSNLRSRRPSITLRRLSELGDDDELSKLRSKRSQIKRKKKESEAIEDMLMESIEPTVELNLDKLPEFKTERPVRRKRVEGDDVTGEEVDTGSKDEAPIVDFCADYDDENAWHIPNRLGVTAAAWGDMKQGFVKSGKLTKRMVASGKFVPGDVQLGIAKLLEGGITVIETSPSYGADLRKEKLSAEDILRQSVQDLDSSLPEAMVVSQMSSGSAIKAILRPGAAAVSSLEASLSRLGESSVDVFLAPKLPLVPLRLVASGLAEQIESGQTNYVGIRDLTSPRSLRRLCDYMELRDCKLTAAAFPYSLTNTKNEDMIAACKECGVVPLITNPLDSGLASGRYTATNPSGGMTEAKFSFKQLEKLQPLHSVQETVAERVRTRVRRTMRDTQERFKSKYGPPPKINTDITTTQIALNWVIAKGGVPLATVNNPGQAEEVLGCLGWQLEQNEVEMIDNAIALCRL